MKKVEQLITSTRDLSGAHKYQCAEAVIVNKLGDLFLVKHNIADRIGFQLVNCFMDSGDDILIALINEIESALNSSGILHIHHERTTVSLTKHFRAPAGFLIPKLTFFIQIESYKPAFNDKCIFIPQDQYAKLRIHPSSQTEENTIEKITSLLQQPITNEEDIITLKSTVIPECIRQYYFLERFKQLKDTESSSFTTPKTSQPVAKKYKSAPKRKEPKPSFATMHSVESSGAAAADHCPVFLFDTAVTIPPSTNADYDEESRSRLPSETGSKPSSQSVSPAPLTVPDVDDIDVEAVDDIKFQSSDSSDKFRSAK